MSCWPGPKAMGGRSREVMYLRIRADCEALSSTANQALPGQAFDPEYRWRPLAIGSAFGVGWGGVHSARDAEGGRMRPTVFAMMGAAALVAGAALYGETHAQTTGANVGTLTCDVAGGVGFVFGSSKELSCLFNRSNGTAE